MSSGASNASEEIGVAVDADVSTAVGVADVAIALADARTDSLDAAEVDAASRS